MHHLFKVKHRYNTLNKKYVLNSSFLWNKWDFGNIFFIHCRTIFKKPNPRYSQLTCTIFRILIQHTWFQYFNIQCWKWPPSKCLWNVKILCCNWKVIITNKLIITLTFLYLPCGNNECRHCLWYQDSCCQFPHLREDYFDTNPSLLDNHYDRSVACTHYVRIRHSNDQTQFVIVLCD